MGVRQQALTEAVVMALRCILLLAIVVMLASVDFVSADGDILHGKDCYSDSQCMRTISYCDNSKGGVLSKVVSGKFRKLWEARWASVELSPGSGLSSPSSSSAWLGQSAAAAFAAHSAPSTPSANA